MKDFWFISLIAMIIIGFATGWGILIRIATAANAVAVLIGVFRQVKGWKNGTQ